MTAECWICAEKGAESYFLKIKLNLSDVIGSGDAETLGVGRRTTCDTLSRDPYIKSRCIGAAMVLALEIWGRITTPGVRGVHGCRHCSWL